MKQLFFTLFLVLICVLFPVQLYAGSASEAQDKVDDARDVITEIMTNPDQGIPPDLLRKVSAVAIFPGVVKAGFVGSSGKCVRTIFMH